MQCGQEEKRENGETGPGSAVVVTYAGPLGSSYSWEEVVSTVMARSAGEPEGTNACVQWGCGLQAKESLPAAVTLLCCRKGAHKKSLQYTCPHPERVASILAIKGYGDVGLADRAS